MAIKWPLADYVIILHQKHKFGSLILTNIDSVSLHYSNVYRGKTGLNENPGDGYQDVGLTDFSLQDRNLL